MIWMNLNKIIDKVWLHDEYREHQKDLVKVGLRQLIEEEKRAFIMSSPVGSGKSPICYTLSKLVPLFLHASGATLEDKLDDVEGMMNEGNSYSGYYITPQIILQNQLKKDYGEHMGIIKGRSNYDCEHGDGTCAEGPCRWKSNQECTVYKPKKEEALSQDVTNTNFSMFIVDNTIKPRDCVVVDEAHNMDSYLLGQVSIELREDRLKNMGWDMPNYEDYEFYVDWMENKIKRLNSRITSLERRLNSQAIQEDDVDDDLVKRHDRLERLAGKMGRLINDYNDTGEPWVVDHEDFYHQKKGVRLEKAIFKPITPYRFMNSMVFSKGQKVVISSATPPSAELMGLSDDEVFKMEVPSTFSIDNRPVYYEPIGKMSKSEREKNVGRMAERVIDISEGKTLIHCRSYQFANMLKKELQRYTSSINIHTQNRSKREKSLDKWKNNSKKYFLSVNMYDGLDLKGDTCRTNIIPIVPFPFLGDEQIQRRLDVEGKQFYNWLTAMRIQQGVGRSTRSKDDYSDSYILDGHFGWFYKQNKKYFEDWFRESLRGI